jgi:hypothetical protein
VQGVVDPLATRESSALASSAYYAMFDTGGLVAPETYPSIARDIDVPLSFSAPVIRSASTINMKFKSFQPLLLPALKKFGFAIARGGLEGAAR